MHLENIITPILALVPVVLMVIINLVFYFHRNYRLKVIPKRDKKGRFIRGSRIMIYSIHQAKCWIELKKWVVINFYVVIFNAILYFIIIIDL